MARRRGKTSGLAVCLALAIALAVTGTASAERFTKPNLDDCGGFSTTGVNPYFIPLDPGDSLRLRGTEDGEEIELLIEILNETENVNGVDTRVMRETETAEGKLVEISRNFIALCDRDNSVTYHGEEVDIYNKKGTEVVSHEGAGRAGDDGATPGILMPGTVVAGSRYFQEVAPDVALDRAEHLTLKSTVKTDEGTFTNCLKVRETTPLEKGASIKQYARGTGLVQDDILKLVEANI